MSSYRATVIAASGAEHLVTIDGADALATLQRIVGGYIQVVPLAADRVLVVNEEGTLLGLPVNARATEIFGASEHGADQRELSERFIDEIVGTVIICPAELLT